MIYDAGLKRFCDENKKKIRQKIDFISPHNQPVIQQTIRNEYLSWIIFEFAALRYLIFTTSDILVHENDHDWLNE